MTYQTIDEDRGALKAQELRRRFRQVSNASMGHRQFGLWPARENRIRADAETRQARINEFFLWCTVGAVVLMAGSILL